MKKYGLVTILAMVAVAMVMIRIGYQDEIDESTLIPTPTVIPTKGSTIDENDYPLWRLLPYSGVGFIVDRYIEPRMLVVKVRGIDEKIVANEIGVWMEENGVNPETHKLVITNQ